MRADKRVEATLIHIIPHPHLALSQSHGISLPDNSGAILSPREKEILGWLAKGKSSWDISVILGISERTVNFHISNVMQKLQAVALAIHCGLIDID